jgi:ABC-2 type transport system ATP-binding protein
VEGHAGVASTLRYLNGRRCNTADSSFKLLLDAPTFGLDPLVQHEVLKLIVEARTAEATISFSSHILSEVQEIADRAGIIRKGLAVEVAKTASLLKRALRQLFPHLTLQVQ